MSYFDNIIIIILLIVICETTAISCIKRFHNQTRSIQYFLLAIIMYSMVCFLLHRSFYLKDSMGMVNVIWSGISVLAVALTGILLFKEKIHLHDIFAGLLITTGMIIFKVTA